MVGELERRLRSLRANPKTRDKISDPHDHSYYHPVEFNEFRLDNDRLMMDCKEYSRGDYDYGTYAVADLLAPNWEELCVQRIAEKKAAEAEEQRIKKRRPMRGNANPNLSGWQS